MCCSFLLHGLTVYVDVKSHLTKKIDFSDGSPGDFGVAHTVELLYEHYPTIIIAVNTYRRSGFGR
jgi:hypothetical protein